MFVIYINSLPAMVQDSMVYLFADDTKIFRYIFSEEDCELLQHDVDRLVGWTKNSLPKFHPDKCTFMRIGKTTVGANNYTMGENKH